MPYGTDVKLYRSTDPNAPVLNGSIGSMVQLLSACLVSGYSSTAVDQLIRDGSIVTATINNGNPFRKWQVVEVSGAVQQDYNGKFRVIDHGTNWFKYELPAGVTPTSPATGTITAKVASAGWQKPFVSGDTYRACFKSGSQSSTGIYLYVNDSAANTAYVKGYEQVVSINDRRNPFPYSTDDSITLYWHKASSTTTVSPWILVADDRFFYLLNNINNSAPRMFAFGDIVSFASYDPYCCVVHGCINTTITATNYGHLFNNSRTDSSWDGNVGSCFARNCLYLANTQANAFGLFPDYTTSYSTANTPLASLSYSAGGIVFSDCCYVCDTTPSTGVRQVRGKIPGCYVPLARFPLVQGTIYETGGRVLIGFDFWNYIGSDLRIQIAVDIIGPWR